jgi:hypothetical protein
MVFHQINGDGAGPIVCSISTDVTGKTFTDITVSKNVPGTNGKSNAANQDFPFVANIPAGTSCTGAVGALKNMYAVTSANPTSSFGGTVLIQIATAGKKREVIGGSLAARVKAKSLNRGGWTLVEFAEGKQGEKRMSCFWAVLLGPEQDLLKHIKPSMAIMIPSASVKHKGYMPIENQ